MKVDKTAPVARLRAALSLLVVLAAFSSALSAPPTADAITRKKIVSRAQNWVNKDIQYSQRGYYGGYRRDCSGFVSMAWKLGKSYTTKTISSRAKRISVKSLKSGDAVLTPGHIVIFVKWKNRKAGTFIALEEANSRYDARKSVRKITRNSVALRRRGITKAKRVSAATSSPVSATGAAAAPASTLAMTAPTPSVAASVPTLATAAPPAA